MNEFWKEKIIQYHQVLANEKRITLSQWNKWNERSRENYESKKLSIILGAMEFYYFQIMQFSCTFSLNCTVKEKGWNRKNEAYF